MDGVEEDHMARDHQEDEDLRRSVIGSCGRGGGETTHRSERQVRREIV